MRIIAGYFRKSYIDRSGNVWQGDAYFDGGGVDANPNRFLFRTSDPTLFQTDRHGEFSYNIPLKPGDYELWLYFVETTFGPGTIGGGGETSRLFDVEVNGHKTILDAFDVYADAGGNFIADVRVFKDIHPEADGYLRISFLRRTGNPFVNAIKVIPGIPGRLRPIRIVAQGDSYTDDGGKVWNPDDYFRGGRSMIRRSPVSGTADPGLFDGERYGNFDYAIPVAQGRYTVTLYFSERYFGPGMPGGGGVGSRVFDVSCNGNTLLNNFDVFKTAGGADRAVVETFHGIEADAQGKLILRFVPVVNYALVDAVAVANP
ncbi:MAG: malectin domain-containing carbohydrate-binding protein [Limisphaerales bacterium]